MSVQIKKFRTIVNKHIKFNEMNPPEKLDVIYSDTGSYAYLSECVADNNPANFQGLKETLEGEFILPGENTYTIDYDSALIAFSDRYTIPSTLYAYYWGGGSVIWAEDVTDLQEACNTIHSNALYKDGSVALEGNLNLNGYQLKNVTTINSINLGTHKHLGQEIDGTTQLTEDSISDLSMSKITGLQTTLDSKQNKLPTYQSGKFLTNNGSALSWGLPYTRNIGEIIQSILPLTDTKLHLLDGSTLSGVGTYNELYNYLLNNSIVNTYSSGIKTVGSLQNESGVLSGFSSSNYAVVPKIFCPLAQEWEVQIKFGYVNTTDEQNLVSSMPDSLNMFTHDVYIMNGSTSSKRFAIDINCPKTDGTVYHTTHYTSGGFSAVNQTWYLRYGYKNSKLYLCHSSSLNSIYSHYDFNDSVPNLVFPYFSFLKFGVSKNLNSSPLLGNLDINECYLKIGDTIVWQGGTSFDQLESEFLVDEDAWQNYNTYFGTCGKFVIDTTNRTVRLPNLVGMLEGTNSSSQLGNVTPAGLPNITGGGLWWESSSRDSDANQLKGSFYVNLKSSGKVGSNATDKDNRCVDFDASRSSAIYGNSSTVQPQTTKVLYYMVVSK